ncbi:MULTISPECIES: hypothetical protein [Deinococcus]|uniref:Uncharacterized protein n=1 Tax=Deinococcus rufus TaxID=2136097 RepID=A0ABV7Z7C0_9DEIO|nr:hypothetical protein [Deinococcus sp. AB2017081]WQE94844.1 hypothetical protein U2P90_15835 [Deinococcus sp. AB2017081]
MPIKSLEGALSTIDAFQGTPEDFKLSIDDTLLDPAGVTMAIITDRILSRDWEPAGVELRQGYRVFSYREME